MDYIKIKITIKKGGIDEVCGILAGEVSGLDIDDPATIDDFVNDKESRWDYIEEGLYDNPKRDPSVTFYVDDSDEGRMQAERVLSLLSPLGGEYDIAREAVRSSDWENNWKQYYKPFKVGSKLYVRPSWEKIEDSEGRRVLIMDPASSFGTGSHATTRLCMEQIDGLDCENKNILDMGCGSGILGCCAMLLGGGRLFSCDIEENAVRTTGENLRLNGIDPDRCRAMCADVLKDKRAAAAVGENGRYDIILANIVADVLKAMADDFRNWLKDDGKLILSGIIDERADEVENWFKGKGFFTYRRLERDGWTMLTVGLAGQKV